ncbi:MAG: efflux RND transporter permease subunit [Desulfatiglans sp.]|jgi:HAE1 family hydrophobic/amphiphilic exporter-1|nr:efflux RND transporter permease subunit [Desulfatiglans sp.]
MKISETSVRRPVTTLMVFLGVILVGAFCFLQMPIDLFPEMDIPSITVITPYEGAGPEEVEDKVTQPLEERLSTVEDLKHIYSTSREGESTIRLMFDWETDLDTRANDVRDAIDLAQRLIPDEADRSQIFKLDISQFPILVFGVFAQESYKDLENLLEDEVANPLESISGVGAARVITPLQRQVNVDLDRERLASYGLTPDDIVRAVVRENREVSAGSIKMGDTDYLPRVPAEFKNVEPMNDIVVRASEGTIVRIRDVGRVTDGFKDLDLEVRVNGKPGAILLVQKQSEANTVEVARRVRAAIPDLEKRLPSDVHIISVMDSSEDIERMVSDLYQTLILGGLLAMLVVLIFLRQVRGTLVIGLAIPFALIASGVVMYLMDYSINMMTLFALIIAIGMVVDNAVVVLENIARHREEGESATEGAVFGTSEVAMAITASTLTTLCIFFPLLFVKGVTRIFFTPFAIVATLVMIASLFTALTMTPMLSSRLLGKKYGSEDEAGFLFRVTEAGFESLAAAYSTILGWCLRHRKIVMLSAALVFVGTMSLIPAIGWEFMPKEDRALIRGTIELPIGTRVERTAEVMREMHKTIFEEVPKEQIRSFYSRCGVSQSGFTTDEGTHVGQFGLKLVPREDRDRHVTEIADAVRKRIERLSSTYGILKFRLDLNDPMAGLIAGGETPLSVNIMSDDLDAADQYADDLMKRVVKVPGTVDVHKSLEKGAPEVWVNVKRQKASAMGLNVSDIGDTVRTSIFGRKAGKYRVRGDEYDIMVRLREEDRSELASLQYLPIRLPSGDLIRAESVADITTELGPIEIERKDQQRIIRVEGDVHGRSLGEAIGEVQALIGQSEIPHGVNVSMGGQSEDIRESFFWLSIALIIGVILVYMVMASQFESLLDPFVVMFSVPVAFVGVIWFLMIGGYNLNIIVFLGMLLLVGIVVNNAIVLVDYINILRARGKAMIEAVQEAGRTRLRPVLMTAITTIVALLPMAFKQGQGSEVWNPLGATILGGLLASTLVTLILVPTVYSIFKDRPDANNHNEKKRDAS